MTSRTYRAIFGTCPFATVAVAVAAAVATVVVAVAAVAVAAILMGSFAFRLDS